MNSTQSTTLRDALEACLSSLVYMDRHFSVVDCTEEIEKGRAALAAADATDQGPDAIPLPQNANGAELMLKLAYKWLEEHAPERLRAARPAPIGAVAPDESRALYTPDNWQVREWALEEAALACENERVEEVGESDISYNFAIKHASDAIRARSAAPAAPIAEVTEGPYPIDFAYPVGEQRRVLLLSEEIVDGERVLCIAIQDPAPSPLLDTIERERVDAEWGKSRDAFDKWFQGEYQADRLCGLDEDTAWAGYQAGQQAGAVDGAPSTNSAAERDAERVNWMIANPSWSIRWRFNGKKKVEQWQMVDDGDSWGQWGDYRAALDAAIATMQQSTSDKEST